jgi:hypothetical protein
MSLKIKFTDTGKAALINPANIGTNALNITTIKVGTASYDPDGTEVDLQAPIKSLNTFGGETVANDIIHVTIRDDSSDTYNIGEIGLFSGDGTLMGVISSVVNPIITQKGMNDVLLLSADAAITEVDISNLTFGGTEFIYSPATPNNAGIIEVADQAEVDAGTPNKAVDAYELKQLLTRRLTDSLNDPSSSKIASAKAAYDLNSIVNQILSLISSDETTLDNLQEIVDFIQLNRSDLDSLSVSAIAGLQATLNSIDSYIGTKLDSAAYTSADVLDKINEVHDLVERNDARFTGPLSVSPDIEYPFYFTAQRIAQSSFEPYQERVVLLIKKSITNEVQDNKIYGEIICSRTGENVWDTISISGQSVYNYSYINFKSDGMSADGHKIVTVIHKGELWLALKLSYAANQYNNIWFYGFSNTFGGNSEDSLTALSYYNNSTLEIVNSEIYNSISDFIPNDNYHYNGYKIFHQGNLDPRLSDYSKTLLWSGEVQLLDLDSVANVTDDAILLIGYISTAGSSFRHYTLLPRVKNNHCYQTAYSVGNIKIHLEHNNGNKIKVKYSYDGVFQSDYYIREVYIIK